MAWRACVFYGRIPASSLTVLVDFSLPQWVHKCAPSFADFSLPQWVHKCAPSFTGESVNGDKLVLSLASLCKQVCRRSCYILEFLSISYQFS